MRVKRIRIKLLGIIAIVIAFLSMVMAQTPTRQVPVDSLIFDLKNPDPVRRKEAARLLG
jgi:hypothetical protein